MSKTVNIGQLREPINIVTQNMIDDGLGGFKADGDPVIVEVFSFWKQVSEGRKMYLGLDQKTNYFTVIIRSMDLPKSAYIDKEGIRYEIKKIQESQNLSGPEMLTLTVSANE